MGAFILRLKPWLSHMFGVEERIVKGVLSIVSVEDLKTK